MKSVTYGVGCALVATVAEMIARGKKHMQIRAYVLCVISVKGWGGLELGSGEWVLCTRHARCIFILVLCCYLIGFNYVK